MAQRYQVDELMRLRDSPLVCKPSDLPPTEEWMGPPLEQNKGPRASGGVTQKPVPLRAKSDDPSKPNDSSARRLSLFETRHASRVSATVPEDIVLGPPKTSFASASVSRNQSQPLDPTDRHTASNNGDDASKNERFNFRERFLKDRERGDREGDRSREQRSGLLQSRRGLKEDGDGWKGVRSRKVSGQDESDYGTRRIGDDEYPDREQGRDGRHRPQRDHDLPKWDTERAAEVGRQGLGRDRNELPWSKDEEAPNGRDHKNSRDNTRGRDWRDKDKDRGNLHVGDREWTRGGRVEQDPEWMGSLEGEEKKQSHTQEDFERWKERMKASSTPAEDKASPRGEDHIGRHGSTSGTSKFEPVSKNDIPLVMDATLDKFFSLWGDSKTDSQVGYEESIGGVARKDSAKANPPKSSRFVGFFNPQPEPPNLTQTTVPPSNPPIVSQDSSYEDKEGFQRILRMLGGVNPVSGESTPQTNSSQAPPPETRDQQSRLFTSDQPLGSKQDNEQHAMAQESNSWSSLKSSGLETLLSAQSPPEGPVQNRDSEFILKLMQQSRISAVPSQSQQYPQRSLPGNAPGLLPFPELIGRSQDVSQKKMPTGPPSGMFDDSLIADLQRAEQSSARELPKRKVTGGHPPMYFDDVSMAPFSRRQAQSNAPKGAPPAFGLPRPPGLDQMPTVWPSQSVAPQQQSHIAPPPGFQNTSRGPTVFPPGLIPNLANPSVLNERGQYARVSGTGQMNLGMPPPGLMGVNGPPPGFPPLPFNPDGIIGMPGSNHYGGPPRSHFDLYGDGGPLGPNGRGAPQDKIAALSSRRHLAIACFRPSADATTSISDNTQRNTIGVVRSCKDWAVVSNICHYRNILLRGKKLLLPVAVAVIRYYHESLTVRGGQPFRFCNLPPEVRNMVYRLLHVKV